MKMKKFPSCQLRDGFCRLGSQSIARGKKPHGGQPKRRGKLADTVKHLLAVVPFVLGIRTTAAEATVRRAGLAIVKLRCFMGGRRACAGKAEAVHRRIRIADEA